MAKPENNELRSKNDDIHLNSPPLTCCGCHSVFPSSPLSFDAAACWFPLVPLVASIIPVMSWAFAANVAQTCHRRIYGEEVLHKPWRGRYKATAPPSCPRLTHIQFKWLFLFYWTVLNRLRGQAFRLVLTSSFDQSIQLVFNLPSPYGART